MARTYWTFRTVRHNYFELVLAPDFPDMTQDYILCTGYQSSKLLDILQAAWYLNYNQRSDLSDQKIHILDSFKM